MKLPLPILRRRHVSSMELSSELFIHEPAIATGKILASEDLVIDAELDGSIASSSHITIGPNAVIKGEVSARSIRHQGSLTGSMSALSQIVLQGGSKLHHSTLHCDSIEVQAGSQLVDVNITTK